MIRWGLCCAFRGEKIKFSTTTAATIGRLSRDLGLAKISRICLANANALLCALQFCNQQGIGCFRINSQILPLKTHPSCGYSIEELPDCTAIVNEFCRCGEFGRLHDIRMSFHPDQFVVLNSLRADVVEASLREIEYQAEVAQWIGADVINIHGGGAFGNRKQALDDFARNVERLSTQARARLTVENDDRIFSPHDLLPLCRKAGIPLVYDVHHHRCHADELTVAEATQAALATWNREPMLHISSPLEGWNGPRPERHHDMIDVRDFPVEWRQLAVDVTIEVEAKAKEIAVLALSRAIEGESHATTQSLEHRTR